MAIFIKKNGILQSAGLFTKSNNTLSSVALFNKEQIFPSPKVSLSAYTWEEIKKLSKAVVKNIITINDLSNTYNISIGSEKSSTINEENHSYRLIGINHDVDADDNVLGMTFEQVDLMENVYVMKSLMSSTDSWQNSDLKTTLEGFSVASDLAAVITPAKKVCANNVLIGTPTYNYINTTNGLWIESETEVFGTQRNTIDNIIEGAIYAYYAEGGVRAKARGGSNANWWLRSPSRFNGISSSFVGVDRNNSYPSTRLETSSTFCVAPCFCV